MKTSSFFLRALSAVAGFSLVAFSFNNCGQVTAKVADLNTLNTAAQNIATDKTTAVLPTCEDSSLYNCVNLNFGKDVVAGIQDGDFSCITLSNGASICPTGTINNANSAGAETLCAKSNCTENYEYSQYFCSVNLPDGVSRSIASTDLSSALQSAYDNCTKTTATK
jgi:hypothetical protein